MLGITAYWVLVALAGFGLVDLIPRRWFPLERLAASLAVGLVGSTALSFGLSLWLGVGSLTALLGPTLIALTAGGLGWRRWAARANREWLGDQLRRPGRWSRDTRWATAVTAILGVAFWLLFRGALYPGPGGQLLANGHVWADWSVHASYAQSFFLGHNLPPTDSLESGTAMRYPFLVDFQPAMLEAVGQNLYGSLDIASFLIGWAASVLIWHLALRVTRRPVAATVAVALLLLGGGLGFVGLYSDGCRQVAGSATAANACTTLTPSTPSAVLGFITHLPTLLTHLPRSYDGEGPAAPALPDLQWYEPLLVYWMPQRDFAYGMALVALTASLLWESAVVRRPGLLISAGLLGACLPFFNPFGYLVVGLLGLWWLARSKLWTGLGAFGLPLLLIGLPQLWFVVSGPKGQLGGPVGTNLFPQIDLGWLSHAAVACTAGQFRAGDVCDSLYLAGASLPTMIAYVTKTLTEGSFYTSFAGFWISNTGVFILAGLLLVGLALWRRGASGDIHRLRLISFWAPFWFLFLLANVVITQPWNWDNTKLLSYWYLGVSIPVAWLLTSGRSLWPRVVAGVAVASLLLSGILSLDAAFVGQSAAAQEAPSGASATFASVAAEQVAAVVRARTPRDAIFLTEGQPNDPVTTLAGRRVVLAYDGWLWSYGQPLTTRFDAVATIYSGCGTAASCQVDALLRRYRIQYIEFEPGDYNDLVLNRGWFERQHLPVLVRRGGYLILRVTSLWRS